MLAVWGLVLATIGLLWFWSNNLGKKKLKDGLKELPGPKGYPIIGNMLDLGQYPHKQFYKWAKEYGSIYQVKIGTFNQIVVSDPKLCKEIFKNPMLNGRIQAPFFDLWESTSGLGLFGSEGELWATHRRFVLRNLRDFGFGKASLESTIMDEVKDLIQTFKTKAGKPVGEIRETMRLAVVNALWTIMSSERFPQTDPRLLRFANNASKTFNDVIAKGGLLLFLPWVRHIIPQWCGYTAVREVLEENKEFFRKSIEQHKKNFREGEEQKDFIDVYLAEMKKQEGDPSSQFYGELAERQLHAICFDLFFAGSDTTAITTAWTTLLLCKFPHVQTKFQQEISEVTGDSRNVSLTDRTNMPYTVALIDEVLRFSSFVPDGVAHRVLADIEFHGYHIPKDALVQPSLTFIHHSKVWGDPENFRPERFLSDDGKKYIKNDSLQAFQVGNRVCLGESLARDNIFLFLTNIFQQFSVKLDPSEPEHTLESEIGFLLAPLPYKVIMTDRLTK